METHNRGYRRAAQEGCLVSRDAWAAGPSAMPEASRPAAHSVAWKLPN